LATLNENPPLIAESRNRHSDTPYPDAMAEREYVSGRKDFDAAAGPPLRRLKLS
jgi:hypothetical protein